MIRMSKTFVAFGTKRPRANDQMHKYFARHSLVNGRTVLCARACIVDLDAKNNKKAAAVCHIKVQLINMSMRTHL